VAIEAEHPAQLQPPVCERQSAQVVALGEPAQRGGALKRRGAEGCSRAGDLQQTAFGHWLSWLQTLVQVAEQMPRQQSGVPVAPAQSSDEAHERGHTAFAGLRHTPSVASEGSTVDAEVQQISPLAVLQSASPEHPVGH
jgi:hypothetical protein